MYLKIKSNYKKLLINKEILKLLQNTRDKRDALVLDIVLDKFNYWYL